MKRIYYSTVILVLLFSMSTTLAIGSVKLTERTPIMVTLSENMRSGQGKPGDEVRYEVIEDIFGPNRELLIKKGTQAYGHIIRTKKRGVFGKSGKLEFSCDYTKAVDDTKVMLRGSDAKSGKGNGGAVVATTLLLTPVALLISGRDVEVKKGTQYTVYVDQDIMIDSTATLPTNTYVIIIKPSVIQDLTQQLIASGKITKDTPVAFSWFELIPETSSKQLDPNVSRNAGDDMMNALAKYTSVIPHNNVEEVANGLHIDMNNALTPNDAKPLGSTVKAKYIITGTISDRGSFVIITANSFDTTTGSIVGNASIEMQK